MRNKNLLITITGLTTLVFISRLFYVQVVSDKYKLSPLSSSTVIAQYEYPDRGYIYDRNGELVVANQSSYDIKVVPKDVKNIDTLELCKLLKISKDSFLKRMEKARNFAPWMSSVFLSHVSKEDYGYLQEIMYRFEGFSIEKHSLRTYPIATAPNVLGYISEVNEKLVKANPYYQSGELIGHTGIEKVYEKELRGLKGVKFFQRNRFNNIIGSYKNGVYDTLAQNGKDIKLTLDIDLQIYGEKLMKDKKGAIIAIEPKSGEILSLVSMPTYNPNMMVGRDRRKNVTLLFNDTHKKPTYDRGLQAQYPPGSPFKIITALIGLQEGVISEQTGFVCYNGYQYGSNKNAFMRCHCGIFGVPLRLTQAITKSCNTYFSNTYRRIIEKYSSASKGLDIWSKHVNSFGLGNYLGYDLPIGTRGLIPTSEFYNKYYPHGNWKAVTTISNAIGQGEILTTPIQLANIASILANRGYYFRPHLLKEIDGIPNQDPKYTEKIYTSIDREHFESVIDGLEGVFKRGTAKMSYLKDISQCGKTGTAENFRRINGEKIKFENHSIFIEFAPKENPTIAIAVYVENGGDGSRIAAPIASLIAERYIKGDTKRKWLEDYVLNISLKKEYEKQKLTLNYLEKKKQ